VSEGGQEAGVELAQQGPQFLDSLAAPPDSVLSSASQHGNRLRQLAIGREPSVGMGTARTAP